MKKKLRSFRLQFFLFEQKLNLKLMLRFILVICYLAITVLKMSVFIVTVDRELEPEISQNAVLLAVHGRRQRGEEHRVRVYQGGEIAPNATEDDKNKLILACLCRVRDYQSDDVAVAFANSWLFQSWEGIQVIGRISDGADIT